MRKTALLLATRVLSLLVASEVALALGSRDPETFCTTDPCLGTDGPDALGGAIESETIDLLAG